MLGSRGWGVARPAIVWVAPLAICLSGCASHFAYFGRNCVASGIAERTGQTISGPACPGDLTIPAEVDCGDGLTSDEAVTLALGNSQSLQELLAELGLTRAAVMDAAQLTNPHFMALLPVGVKQLEFALTVPLESIWVRPERIAAASLESQRVGNRLVQDGLNLVRDVRAAHADLLLAVSRLELAQQSVELRGKIVALVEAQERSGAATPLDVSTASIDRLLEEQQALRQTHEVELARQRLKTLLGFALTDLQIEPAASPGVPEFAFDTEELVSRALDSRPDLWAAGFAVRAAERRSHLAQYDWFQFSAFLPDANGKGQKGFEAGPGMNFTVPIFHQNQAAIARTRAEAEQARRRCETLRNQVAMEVRQACIRVAQAQESLRFCQDKLVPECQQAVVTSEKAYRGGAASLLLLLENNRQLLASQVRQAEAMAELRRAIAELERSVGERVMPHADEAGSFNP